MTERLVTLADVEAARERIAGRVLRTPLVELLGTGLRLKAENLQPIGAFKLRGAFNALLSLPAEERLRGVIADSSGNHAQAVAYAARALDMRAVIVMPPYAPQVKIEATRRLGAEVDLVEGDRATHARVARDRAADEGLVLIPPFEHRDVIAGQGTLGLEIVEDAPEVDLVLVPVSGGGMISGVAVAVKSLAPGARVVGVEPEAVDDARRSLRSGSIESNPPGAEKLTKADGLRVNQLGELTFAHIRELVDDIVTVSEDDIVDAMSTIARRAQTRCRAERCRRDRGVAAPPRRVGGRAGARRGSERRQRRAGTARAGCVRRVRGVGQQLTIGEQTRSLHSVVHTLGETRVVCAPVLNVAVLIRPAGDDRDVVEVRVLHTLTAEAANA